MVTATKRYTAQDLLTMADREHLELWDGELVEESPSFIDSSVVAHWIGVRISNFVEPNDLGFVSGEAGGYLLFPDGNTVVAPDIGFVRWSKLPGRKRPRGFCNVPPDLAIEVQSPSDKPAQIERKLKLYMDAGVLLVWWVDLDKRLVRVNRPGRKTLVLRESDVLDGEDVLPGFRLALADIFAV